MCKNVRSISQKSKVNIKSFFLLPKFNYLWLFLKPLCQVTSSSPWEMIHRYTSSRHQNLPSFLKEKENKAISTKYRNLLFITQKNIQCFSDNLWHVEVLRGCPSALKTLCIYFEILEVLCQVYNLHIGVGKKSLIDPRDNILYVSGRCQW